MGLNLVAASTQYLQNTSSPVAGPPFTVGFWVFTRSLADEINVFLLDNAGNSDSYVIKILTSGQVDIRVVGTPEVIASAASGTIVVNTWNFVLLRCISTTNTRIHVLKATGIINSGNSTATTKTFTTDRLTIGGDWDGGAGHTGVIAEFWYTNTDIQPDGLVIQDALMRQLAYSGPFSLSGVAKDIVEYRSFRNGVREGNGTDIFWNTRGRQAYTVNGAPLIGIHPPLPYYYNRPLETEQLIPFNRMFRTGVLDVIAAAGQAHLLEGKFAGKQIGKFG